MLLVCRLGWVIVVSMGSMMPLMGCTPYSSQFKQTSAQQTALLNVELGLGYLEQGERARAKTKLTHACALAPHLPETKGAMAYFREIVGDHRDADCLYRQAIQVATHKGAVYNNYGAYLCRQARYKEADIFFQKALQDKTYARTAEVYENAGLCVLKSSDAPDALLAAKAMHYFTQALQNDPEREQARSALEHLKQQRENLS